MVEHFARWTCDSCSVRVDVHGNYGVEAGAKGWRTVMSAFGAPPWRDPTYGPSWQMFHLCPVCADVVLDGKRMRDLSDLCPKGDG